MSSCTRCEAPSTIRSRCQALHLSLPDATLALDWLRGHAVVQPEVLLGAVARLLPQATPAQEKA